MLNIYESELVNIDSKALTYFNLYRNQAPGIMLIEHDHFSSDVNLIEQ